MKKLKIFIACDTNKISKVKKIIAQTKTNKLEIGYKFGLEFFYAKGGREFISKLKKKNIFLDLKLNDIPATCAAAIRSLKDLSNINYITLHANAGEESIKTVVKSAKNNTKQKVGRKSRFQSLIIEKDFEPENPKKLEELTDNDCKYPIGHPDEPGFYFCGRTSLKDFSYCRLHLLYSYQSRNKKEETNNNEEEVPEFIEKKIKSA